MFLFADIGISTLYPLFVSSLVFQAVKLNPCFIERGESSSFNNLGKSVSDTEKSLGIDLASKSDFPFINDIDKFNYIYEPAKTVEIDGVNVPRWLIICHTDSAEVMQRVSYYDCTLLKKNSHGVKKSGKVNGAAVATGMTRKQAEKTINLEPFVIANYADGTQIRKYKYHYNDKATKNDTSYYLTIMFDKDGKVSAPVIEKENVFITDILTCE